MSGNNCKLISLNSMMCTTKFVDLNQLLSLIIVMKKSVFQNFRD